MPGTAPAAPTISTMMRTIRIGPTAVDWVVPEAACAAGGRTLKGCGVGELEAQAVLPAAAAPGDVEVDAAGDVDVGADGDRDVDADGDGDAAAAQVAGAADPVVAVEPPPAVVLPPPVVVLPPVVCCEVPPGDDVARAEVVGLPEDFTVAPARVFSLVTTDRACACRLEVSGR